MNPKSVKPQDRTLFYTLIALVGALVVGLGLRLGCPQSVADAAGTYLLTPVKTMYLNALKLVVAPVVFCSIASSIAGISDYKTYGKIGLRVAGLYLLSSLAAVCVGIGTASLLHPGTGVTLTGSASYTAEATEVSLLSTIVSIIPTNLITPFQESNMTQIIFLALLMGAASGMLEQQAGMPQFHQMLRALHQLFLSIASLVLRLIPVGTFCAVVLLVLEIDGAMLLSLLQLIGTVLLGAMVMGLLYSLLFLLATRLSPLRLWKKCLPNLTSFAVLCSTSAVLPQTLETCTDRLGIDPEISFFSIPLGSTINMDGACIYLTIAALFLAQIYGVTVTRDMLFQLVLTTLLLSVGAPPIPGAGFICLSVLVLQMGIPMESIGFLLGIDQLMSMIRTVINGSGDIVSTSVIAFRAKRMDTEVFLKD